MVHFEKFRESHVLSQRGEEKGSREMWGVGKAGNVIYYWWGTVVTAVAHPTTVTYSQ